MNKQDPSKADIKYLMEYRRDPFRPAEEKNVPDVWVLFCCVEYGGQTVSYEPVAVFNSDWDAKAFARFTWDGGTIDVGHSMRGLFESQDKLVESNE